MPFTYVSHLTSCGGGWIGLADIKELYPDVFRNDLHNKNNNIDSPVTNNNKEITANAFEAMQTKTRWNSWTKIHTNANKARYWMIRNVISNGGKTLAVVN